MATIEYGAPAEEYTIEAEEAAANVSREMEESSRSPEPGRESADSLESKLHEIVKQSQLSDNSEQYIQVYREEDGEKISTITIDGNVVESSDGSLIHADQIVGYDLMNFKVINCEDDVAQEIITDDGDVEIHDETQYLVQQVQDTNDDGSLSEYDSKHMRKETQYLHVVERDSIPLVFFSNGPTIPQTPPQESRKTLPKRRKVMSNLSFDASKFKLFLYNCKQCAFKCNAIKDLTAHRLKEHTTSNSSGRYRNISKANAPTRPSSILTEKASAGIIFGVNMSYCSICSYSSISSQQVKRHIIKVHSGSKESSNEAIEENGGFLDIKEEINVKEEKLTPYDKSHDRESSQTSSRMYQCEDCGFGTNNVTKYQKHVCKIKAHSSR